MSDKQRFWYLSFITGLIFSVYFNITFWVVAPGSHSNELLLIVLMFAVAMLFGPFFVGFLLLITDKYILKLVDANLTTLFRNYPKAIELYLEVIEELQAYAPKSKFKQIMKLDYIKIVYLNLIHCYAKLNDLENAKLYLEKYLECLPENKREKEKNRIYKKYHFDNPVPLESYEKRVVKTGLKVMVFTIIGLWLLCLLKSTIYYGTDIKIIAETDSLEKVAEIQELLLNPKGVAIREDGSKYQIGLCDASVREADEASLLLADSSIFDKNYIGIKSGVRFYKNIEKAEKALNRAYSRKFNLMFGVENSTVDIKLNATSMFDENWIPPTAKVDITLSGNADKNAISKIVKNMLLSSIRGISEENIEINFIDSEEVNEKDYPVSALSIYEKLARNYYFHGDYVKAEKYLKEFAKRAPYSIEKSFRDMKKIQQLNALIAKNSNDYKLYIQLADLENVPDLYSMFNPSEASITSDYYLAIMDYKRALELNPKAYEVYEKLANAYMECDLQPYVDHHLEKSPEDYKNARYYYEKAVEYIEGNDYLYTRLGKLYSEDNPQKAIEYYSKIDNIYEPYNNVRVPIPADSYPKFKIAFSSPSLDIADLYVKIDDYENALKYIDETIANSKSDFVIQDANNLKFLYNWQSKNYKTALKQADNCSVWVCKALGLLF